MLLVSWCVYTYFYSVTREVWNTMTLIPHHLGILIVPADKRTSMNFGGCQSSDEVILLQTFLSVKIVLHNTHASHLMSWKEVVHLIYKTVRAASFMKLSYDRLFFFFPYLILVAQIGQFKREKNSFYLLCKRKIRIKWEETSWSNVFHVHWLVWLQKFWHSILRNRFDLLTFRTGNHGRRMFEHIDEYILFICMVLKLCFSENLDKNSLFKLLMLQFFP